jgi:hypothetical protein
VREHNDHISRPAVLEHAESSRTREEGRSRRGSKTIAKSNIGLIEFMDTCPQRHDIHRYGQSHRLAIDFPSSNS